MEKLMGFQCSVYLKNSDTRKISHEEYHIEFERIMERFEKIFGENIAAMGGGPVRYNCLLKKGVFQEEDIIKILQEEFNTSSEKEEVEKFEVYNIW